MVIVKACFDESGKPKDKDYVVFAGAVATDDQWSVISEQWNAILTENHIRYLTMKEAFRFKGEFKDWRERKTDRDRLLVKLATMAHPLLAFYVSAPIENKDFENLPDKQRAKLKHVQYCGFEACVRKTIETVKNREMRVHIYCDSSEDYSRECLELYINLKRTHLDMREKCIAITFADDEHFPPLQMADMIAYCVRHGRGDKPEPVITELLKIFGQDGIGTSGLVYTAEGKGLGSGLLEPTSSFKKYEPTKEIPRS